MASRRSNRWWLGLGATAAVIVLVLLAAVWLTRHMTLRGGPLSMGDAETGVSFPVNVGETMTYGDMIITNTGAQEISITKVELVQAKPGAVVDDVLILDIDAVPPGTLIGTDRGFNPPAAAKKVEGAILQPAAAKKQYQLIFAVRATSEGPALFSAVRINYLVNGQRYVRTGDHKLRICTPYGVFCELPPKQ